MAAGQHRAQPLRQPHDALARHTGDGPVISPLLAVGEHCGHCLDVKNSIEGLVGYVATSSQVLGDDLQRVDIHVSRVFTETESISILHSIKREHFTFSKGVTTWSLQVAGLLTRHSVTNSSPGSVLFLVTDDGFFQALSVTVPFQIFVTANSLDQRIYKLVQEEL